jgi:hypothetical protein
LKKLVIDIHAIKLLGIKNPLLTAVALIVILAAGGLLTWWTAARANREMRENLIQQTLTAIRI